VVLKDKVEATSEEAHRIVGELRRRYAGENINILDGLKIQLADASVHLRPSNTGPVIRIMAEARNGENSPASARRPSAGSPGLYAGWAWGTQTFRYRRARS